MSDEVIKQYHDASRPFSNPLNDWSWQVAKFLERRMPKRIITTELDSKHMSLLDELIIQLRSRGFFILTAAVHFSARLATRWDLMRREPSSSAVFIRRHLPHIHQVLKVLGSFFFLTRPLFFCSPRSAKNKQGNETSADWIWMRSNEEWGGGSRKKQTRQSSSTTKGT